MIRGDAFAAALYLGAASVASADVGIVDYRCDRDARLSAAYVTGGETDLLVMQIEGRLVALEKAPSGSGVLYAEIGKDDGYIFFAKGDEALLGHGGTEGTTILPGCRAATGDDAD